MTFRIPPSSQKVVLWGQVIGLALVQGAIALMWVIYNLYLVDLLTQVGIGRSWAAVLLIIENLLAMVMEPLMGSLGDRLQQQMGTRFPLISLGVILAAGVFLSLPVIALAGASAVLRVVLPLMLVGWALAMTLFRSPAMSLLGRYAFGTQLPQAASILTLVGGVAGAMGPLASEQILGWGPIAAFAIGSGVLVIAMVALRLSAPDATVHPPQPAMSQTLPGRALISPLLCVFGAGVGVTLGFRFLMVLFSRVADGRAPDGNPGWLLGTIFVALALTAIPSGVLAIRLGNRRAMVLGLGILAFVCIGVGAIRPSGPAIALAALFGAAFSLVSNGTIPFALSMVPASKAGLGTGMFFSGGAAASSIFGTVADGLKTAPVILPSALGVLALLFAGGCIAGAPRHLGAPLPSSVEP